MTYDQAQSPRLGQRTPVESTYVQIFDVDPTTPEADLLEVAWPGMLIFRSDLHILQIYNGTLNAWEDVAGGVAGQLTYVGAVEPTGPALNEGDIWFDTSAGYAQSVYHGGVWVPVTAAGGGIQTYYENGFIPNPDFNPILEPDPITNPYNLWVPLAGTFTTGDLWYQIDDDNHPFRWSGEWVSILNPDIPYIEQNQSAIIDINTTLNEASYLATSANNTADTAEGQVSMSDYEPGPDDVAFETSKIVPDPVTGEPIEEFYLTPRANGSVWFVRTRKRTNLCTNPSLEVDAVGWAGIGTTSITRHDHHTVPAGEWTLHVINTATDVPHGVSYGASARLSCVEGDHYAASVYAEQLTVLGVDEFVTLTMSILWHDSGGTVIGTSTGDPYTLLLDAFPAALMGTIAEPRVWVTDEAPVGAVSYYVQVMCGPEPQAEGLEWHTGAMLIEQEDDLGRYFDGDSYPNMLGEAHWEGTPHASVSFLEGAKIMEVWELRDNTWLRKYYTDTTIYSLSAYKLVGTLNNETIADNSLTPEKMVTGYVTASEALVAGNIVNVWNSAGQFRVRKACAGPTNRAEAHGFILDSVAAGAIVRVYHMGYNRLLTELAPGNQFLSTIAGEVTNQPPTTIGAIVQAVGFAPLNYVLDFNPTAPVRLI
jgi:hypothetical protein